MAIVTVCQGCGQRLSVADEHAGRTARCPKCKREYTVPAATPSTASLGSDQWRMRTDDGRVYGPVTKAELDQWVAEGRVTVGSQLLREGDAHWHAAEKTYPQLQASSSANPFGEPQKQANPYASPAAFSPSAPRRWRQPHRGGVILTLGILGVLCCQLLGPVAWIMGQADMRQINEGIMDPEGRSLTQVGMILGIIGTVLLVLSVGVQMLAVMAQAM